MKARLNKVKTQFVIKTRIGIHFSPGRIENDDFVEDYIPYEEDWEEEDWEEEDWEDDEDYIEDI